MNVDGKAAAAYQAFHAALDVIYRHHVVALAEDVEHILGKHFNRHSPLAEKADYAKFWLEMHGCRFSYCGQWQTDDKSGPYRFVIAYSPDTRTNALYKELSGDRIKLVSLLPLDVNVIEEVKIQPLPEEAACLAI
jgi:hypothetical protein